ncbi:ABC transporter permease [Lysinibacillus sp. SGAir0095]|uniref:lmo0954 family membrane protein n=1 Tax=Lysinibacillus sp. SGAir0095 TaxID=2070463 RepID=UPI0010CD3761|nr:ABC transporter permease [Lysinibacillus sp. SGAir0095]QCR32059.1 ABC transporter permease [Lysinibacillus sp. SGAir0095]
MKKLFLLVVGAIAAIVALSMLGPLVGFAFSALLIYLGMHYYVKSNSGFGKVFWVALGLIGILTAISNVPAIIGLAAIFTIYLLYKKWNNEEVSFRGAKVLKEDDPFTNFETEWAKLTK